MTGDRIRSRVLSSGKPLITGGRHWAVYYAMTRAGPPRDGEPCVTFKLAHNQEDAFRKARALHQGAT